LRKGSDVARDADGVPTGVTTETFDLLPGDMYTIDQMREAVRANVVPNFVAKGITSLVNLPATLHDLPIDHALQAGGLLPIRIRTYYIIPQVFTLDSLNDMGMLPGEGHDMWRFGGVKVFVAGAGQDAHLNRLADLKWTQDELNDMLWRCHSAGYQVLMHEAGHDSFELAVNAVEYAQGKMQRDMRHRLEHYAQLESLDEIRRVKRLGMRVSITAPAIKGGGRPDAKTPRYATLIREGLQPVSISDTTGTVPDFAPLRGMAAIVAPQSEGGSTPQGEAPSFEDAVRMWTSWAANSMFEEQDKGSIMPGKLGDFTVLNGDAETKKGGALFDLAVDATILGGKTVWQR
jgi:predicted amidohydrolase YtcJ